MERVRTADVCTRFSMLVKAFVAHRDEVSVLSAVSVCGDPLIRIVTAAQDRWQMVDGRCEVARALRVLLDCIGEQQGVRYVLEINGLLVEPSDPGPVEVEALAATPKPWASTGAMPVL